MDLSLSAPGARVRGELLLAEILCAITCALGVAAVAATLAEGRGTLAGELSAYAILGSGFAGLGALVLSRNPRHVIGWLFLVVGLSHALAIGAEALRPHLDPLTTRAADDPTWLAASLSMPAVAASPLIVALFPDGRLPHRRWRAVPWLAASALTLLVIAVPIGMSPYRGESLVTETLAPTASGPLVSTLFVLAQALLAAAIALGLCAFAARTRAATGELRQQMKWFALGLATAMALAVADKAWPHWWLGVLGSLAMLAGIMLGILRYRLYDIDRFLGRTAAYGVTTLALIGIFAALDVTLAVALGGDSTIIAAVSAFTVALLLRPARDRAQDLVNRILDRRVRTAVGLLRALGERTGTRSVSPSTLVRTLRQALHDPDLDVYFATEGPHWLNAAGTTVPSIPARPGLSAAPIARDGRTLAVIVHRAVDASLFGPVMQAAAVALEHARLQVELQRQIGEVHESRMRLAAAAAAERRRIERNLHDGAQQRLIALALHIQAERRQAHYPDTVNQLLDRAVDQLNAGVGEIRALVRGILPPALASGGLIAVFEERAFPEQVTVHCDVRDRLHPDVEATAWFVTSEAIANATKHAPGGKVEARITRTSTAVVVAVRDDGPGGADLSGAGLRGLADRTAAQCGTFTVTSPPGEGTVVRAEIPCAS